MLINQKKGLVLLTGLIAVAVSACTTVPTTAQDATAQGTLAPAATTLEVSKSARALLPPEIRRKGVLTIASGTNSPPIVYFDSDNKTLIGFDVAMGDAVGQVLGLKTEHVVAGFDTILPGLTSGKYDLGISNISITDERKKVVDFVPEVMAGSGIAVLAGNPEGLSVKSEALCGKRIGVLNGGIAAVKYIPALSKECTDIGEPAIEMSTLPTNAKGTLALSAGRVDGMMAPASVLSYQGKLAGNKFELAPGGSYNLSPIGIALKEDSSLEPAVREAMKAIISTPAYGEMIERWGLPEDSAISPDLLAAR